MARCNDCNKFVAYGEPEIEIVSAEVEDDLIEGEVRIALTCENCGNELKEANIDFFLAIEHECDGEEKEGDRYEIVDSSAEPNQRTQSVGRDGKAIKNPRYMKTYYGADMTFTVHCAWCGESFSVETDAEEQASAFEEL